MTEPGGESDEQALRAAVTALYAVAPADFVAARKEWVARVRTDGHPEVARQVAALRKPSVSAAAVNALVRADDAVVAELRDVGTRLRHAQSALDAAGLAALRGDRDALLRAWGAAAREHAAATLSPAVEGEIRDTAVAALADADATEVVLSGALTRALSYSGFGEVDVADAVARTSTGVVLTRIRGGGAGPAGAEKSAGSGDGGDAGEASPTHGDGGDATEDTSDSDERDAQGFADSAERDDSPDSPEQDAGSGRDHRALRAELDAAEDEVASARDRRRAAADALAAAQEKRRVAASGVDQARRLLAQAEKHAAAAESAERAAGTEAEDAEDALTRSRTRRDRARTALEEAEDS